MLHWGLELDQQYVLLLQHECCIVVADTGLQLDAGRLPVFVRGVLPRPLEVLVASMERRFLSVVVTQRSVDQHMCRSRRVALAWAIWRCGLRLAACETTAARGVKERAFARRRASSWPDVDSNFGLRWQSLLLRLRNSANLRTTFTRLHLVKQKPKCHMALYDA